MKILFGAADHIDKQNVPAHETFEARLKLAQIYDEAGFYAYHVTEHHFTPLGLAPSPNIFIAAASQVTTKLRFAPMVLVLPLYDPLRLASEICMIDHMTKGRYEFAVGRGISPYELAYYNVSHLDAPHKFREGLQVLLAALTQDRVDFSGEFFKYRSVPIELSPYQRPLPPMWVATGNEAGAADAARRGLNLVLNKPAAAAAPIIDIFRRTWREHHGASGKPQPKAGIMRGIFLDENAERARETGMRHHRTWVEKFNYLWNKFDPRMQDPQMAEKMASGTMFMGDPAGARAWVAQEIETSGADYLIGRFAFGNMTFEESARSVGLFAQDVMPAFR